MPLLSALPLEVRDLPSLLGATLFPPDNPWNQRVADAPVAANSAAVMAALTAAGNGRIHPDFGEDTRGANDLYGIPYNVVRGNSAPRMNVVIDAYAGESDVVAVPMPASVVLEGDYQNGPKPGVDARGDSHLLIFDVDNNRAYEFYRASRPSENADGRWHADQQSVWDTSGNTFRPLTWTSADAAGLPILPGLVRPDEALPVSQGGQGVITHAIRFTLQNSRVLNQFVFPASHTANPGNTNATTMPPMGARFRLKATVDLSQLNPQTRVIAQAMKDYGLILADNGSNFYFSGASYSVDADNGFARTFDDDDIQDTTRGLKSLRFADFELIDLTPQVTGLNTTTAAAGDAILVGGQNFGGAAGHLAVFFGSTPATNVTILSDSQLRVVVPAGSGAVNVTVTSGVGVPGVPQNTKNPVFGYGVSPVTTAGRFTYGNPLPPGTTPPPPNPPTTPNPPAPDPGNGPGAPPTRPRLTPREFSAGGDRGSGLVRLYDPDGSLRFTASPFGAGFTGGVRTAGADFTGDGVNDVAAGTGPGGPTRVVVLDGVTQRVLFDVPPFETAFVGGVYVAAGDLDGDGFADLIVTPDEGGGPRVQVYAGAGFGKLADFFGIDDPTFRGGARAALGDFTGDGAADLVVSAGFGGGPRVALYDGRTLRGGRTKLAADFFLFEPALRNGAFVAAGDVDGDGRADLIGGGGPGGAPRVLVLGGADLLAGRGGNAAALANFFAGNAADRGGVRVAARDLDGDGRADVVAGDGTGSRVTGYVGGAATFGFDAFPGLAGVFVG